jgi:hypothetical protein
MFVMDMDRPKLPAALWCELLQIDWELFIQTLLKGVEDLPEDLWNPLLVYDTTYFQNLAVILANTKTESLRKLLHCTLKWLSWRLTV